MKPQSLTEIALRVAIAGTLATSGYIHAQLYVSDYRYIHIVGVLFLLQASASFALAALVLAGGPIYVRIGAGGAAAGALGGFAASRTVGVFGFTEHGWQPSPQSLTSVLVEVATLLLLVPTGLEIVKRIGR
ncbi:conserved hypothetical protein [Catenulispora acidiphila DSM 44928]|uniref:Integral membrane protein n=1 Tax=Catenulispora acidiphila (strain DSM 44928 / JCM 14897 / NBRC 102108 / NRRL B-24433 / ID139908) TaxID=479433 RepID=C7PXI8_CATAD|nr:hypothetical protein [Catenulispora acidiphila]ACU71441.1 conserved hypothetical protein [Catenulispora acidiphila DSM 44928]